MLVCLIKLVKLRHEECYKCKVILLPCWSQMTGIHREPSTTISRDNFQLAQPSFVFYRKNFEEVVFVDKEFLHKMIHNKDVFVEYGTTRCGQILDDAVKQCPSYETLTTLKYISD